jgi:phospholipase/lecithinase/hemolysin
VAIPGALVLDALTNNTDNGADPNELTNFILGGRTQIEAATSKNPTFASVWLGNNDALDAALAGEPDSLTSQSDFESNYKSILDQLESAGAEGGVIANVFDVTQVPNLSPGVAYYQARSSLPISVDGNCDLTANGGVGDQVFISFRYGATLLQVARSTGQSVTLDCQDNRTLAQIFGDALLDQLELSDEEKKYSILIEAPTNAAPGTNANEITQIRSAVQDYNNFLSQEAQDRGWAYVDANSVLDNLHSDPTLVPRFPDLQNTPTFGPVFSEDGIHPNSEAHQLIANEFINAINSKYGSSLQNVESASF